MFTLCACDVQEDFWMVPVYKRALTFVFLVRYSLGYKSQMQWKKFTAADFKLNTRLFKRWSNLEVHVMHQSQKFQDLIDRVHVPTPTKKRKAPMESVTETDSPMKKVFTFDSESSGDE